MIKKDNTQKKAKKDIFYYTLFMSKLIIVCGLTASGKTTFAAELSKQLKISCIHKDSIKERLYEILKYSTLEQSKELGAQSMQLLYALTEEQIVNNVDIILEAPFTYEEDYKIFADWINKYHVQIYTIICSVSESERQIRYRNRPRHAAHHDYERRDLEIFQHDQEVYKNIPGKKIQITTDQPTLILVQKAIKEM